MRESHGHMTMISQTIEHEDAEGDTVRKGAHNGHDVVPNCWRSSAADYNGAFYSRGRINDHICLGSEGER
ncbi:hypothetical protein CDAR_392251 [Caerostris darwini]|uniref:Uncharacterized protein n=1 Tax=Caerostris darwini TaxID=1538125 RepID=A0AAV4SR51_9ARAC|nr:hypothetical protein CDAR_392251 [Caerostris darwini]